MRVAVLGDVGDQKVVEVVVRLIAGVCGAEEARASGAGGAEPPPLGQIWQRRGVIPVRPIHLHSFPSLTSDYPQQG